MTCEGRSNWDWIRQTGANSCWAAATASAVKLFRGTNEKTEVAFAQDFWNNPTCPEAIAKPGAPWDRVVTNLSCVLQHAGLVARKEAKLTEKALMKALKSRALVFCVQRPAGASIADHVVTVWKACSGRRGKEARVWVHDPASQSAGVDEFDRDDMDTYLETATREFFVVSDK